MAQEGRDLLHGHAAGMEMSRDRVPERVGDHLATELGTLTTHGRSTGAKGMIGRRLPVRARPGGLRSTKLRSRLTWPRVRSSTAPGRAPVPSASKKNTLT